LLNKKSVLVCSRNLPSQ